MKLLIIVLGASLAAQGHDVITTPITWGREISRIVHQRCIACHHDGGSAFSLVAYADIRPWGAVKGFGDFRNDQGLTAEQLELIASWANGGVPEGDGKDLPAALSADSVYQTDAPADGIRVSGELNLDKPIFLDGLYPRATSKSASFQITAQFPDGTVEPLLWLSNYQNRFKHSFLLRTPLELPAGTIILGVPPDATVLLHPAASDSTEAVTKSEGE